MKQVITTSLAPTAIGTYSQAIKTNDTIYLSGQIPLDPVTMQVIDGDIAVQIRQVFVNLQEVVKAAGGTLDDIVKLTVYLTHISDLVKVNEIMPEFFKEPYPARTSIAVAALPKNVSVEIEGILIR